jgi:hypothetical protein
MRMLLAKEFWNFFFLAKLDTAKGFSSHYYFGNYIFRAIWWIGIIALVGICADQSHSTLLAVLRVVMEWVWAYIAAWAVIGGAERFSFKFLKPTARPANMFYNVLGILCFFCAYLVARHLVGSVQVALALPFHH